jgi:cell fate regulator YaaT (PSP1 superfamily)
MIAIEGVSGYDVAMVSVTGELVKLQMKKYGVKEDPQMKRVLRLATKEDLENYNKQKTREKDVMVQSRAIARQLNLEMKISEVEIQADGKKATFFYTADGRVDFRELIKVYASEFKLKVEMRQIGARQESAKVGGIGSCGRELCCSTWLTDFKSVNTNAARYQNLSINQTKLSGQCGRLKCCLNYELDTYMDALRVFPDKAEVILTTQGEAFLSKKDIFRNLMWYSYKDSSKQYPLTIERVKEIQKLNAQGKRPDELQPVELETSANKAGVKVEMGFVNDVGQISLKSLEKGSRKRGNSGNRNSGRPQQGTPNSRQGGGGNHGNKPQQGQKPEQGQKPQQGQKQQQGQKPQQKPNNPQQKQEGQKPANNNPNQRNNNNRRQPKHPTS